MTTRVSVNSGSLLQNLEATGILALIGLVFLLPLWFLPTSFFPVLFSKTLLAGLVAFLLAGIFVLGRLKAGSVLLPRSVMVIAALLLPAAYALSALFSDSPAASFLGQMIEIDTVFFVVIASLLLLLTGFLVRTQQAVFNMAAALLGAFLLLSVYQLFHLLISPSVLSFGIFTGISATPLGSWVDIGAFAGLAALLVLITLELLPVEKTTRVILYVALALATIFLVVVNTVAVWYVLASSATLLALYRLSQAPKGVAYHPRHIPFRLAAAVVISIFFIFFGPAVNARISQTLGVSEIEARPSWQGTYAIGKETVSSQTLFGIGPNQFDRAWNLYRPQAVNVTPFWGVDFAMGIGVVPTALVTTGLVGFLAWLFLLGSIVWEGYRVMRAPRADAFVHYLTVLTLGAALYFVQLFVMHVPTPGMYLLGFIFFGLFLAHLRNREAITEKEVLFSGNPILSFGFISLFIVLLVGSVAGLYFLAGKGAGVAFFNRGATVYAETQDIDKAEALVARANRVDENDSYYRALSQLRLVRLGNLLNQSSTLPQEQVRAEFQTLLRDAIAYAQAAVAYDQYEYLNHIALAQAYESVVPLKISNAYENALSTYITAQSFAPKSPALPLALARLELLNDKPELAGKYIEAAFALKPDYTEAAFLSSQIAVALGDVKGAIASAEKTVTLAPNEPVAYFQLGLLYYNERRYADAIAAFERAVGLQGAYANARYFLGLSYASVGKSPDAIQQFEAIQVTNPDNKEVKAILENLRAGRPPLAGAATEEKNVPEKRPQLPVSDKKQEPSF
ncbi:tetratricopeptide repeat protein [Candidatus Parcubacteria bacterium]|nr:tetratricopeptide repeat protein [Candidatus Parcubacteria bacterium]